MKTSKLLLTTAIIASLGTTAFAADTTNQISGNLNQVEGENNIVLGNSNNVAAYSSVTIGNHVYSHARTYNEEETSGIYSFSPKNKGNIAIGDHTKVDVRAGTAIGYLAQSFGDASVAIGAYSMAYDDVHKVDSKYAGVKTNQGVFSIGSSYAPFYDKGTTPEAKFRVFTRQLQNVGAGEISAKSTDAVNGSQLYDVMMEAQKHTVVQSGDDNIVVDGEDGFYTVSTSKNLNLESVKLNDGNNESSYTTEGISMVHRGDGTEPVYNTTYNYNGIRIATNDGNARPIDEITLTADGLNNGGKKITNVSRGEKDTDAINVSQLKEVGNKVNDNSKRIDTNENRINDISAKVDKNKEVLGNHEGRITTLENKVTDIGTNAINQANHYTDMQVAKVGANAAALAALHPLDYNPDHKTDIMAGVGHYKGKTAVALGVSHRPNENTMVTFGTTINGKDTMVNAGVSYKVGSKGSTYKSPLKMAKEIDDLKAIVDKLLKDNQELHKALENK